MHMWKLYIWKKNTNKKLVLILHVSADSLKDSDSDFNSLPVAVLHLFLSISPVNITTRPLTYIYLPGSQCAYLCSGHFEHLLSVNKDLTSHLNIFPFMRIISSSNRNRLVSSELTNVIYFRKENIELKLRSFAILNKFETKCFSNLSGICFHYKWRKC